MRVLHVFKTYYPDTHGGTEQFIHQLATKTSELGVDNTIFTLSPEPPYGEIVIRGIRVIRVKRTGNLFSMPWSFSGFWVFNKLVKKNDIIHLHHAWPYADMCYLLFGRYKPALTTYHLDLVRSKYVLIVYKYLMRALFSRLKFIICTSQPYLESSEPLRPFLNKSQVIPIGLSENIYPRCDDSLSKFWFSEIGEGFILFIGAFRYYKGLFDLIHACALDPVPLVLLGGGPLENEIRLMVKELKLERHVKFVGAVDDLNKMAILHLASAVVLPSSSRAEAFGISLLEGMMAQKALICTELSSGTSWVNQDGLTGYVVPPCNPLKLSFAMQKIIKDPVRTKEMGVASRKRFEDFFQVDLMADQYFNLYKSLIN